MEDDINCFEKGKYADYLLKQTRNAIELDVGRNHDWVPPVGASKIGGLPNLPADLDWPVCAGVPQLFLAQFNLAETASYDKERLLPPRGFLFFFMKNRMVDFDNPEVKNQWRVLYRDACPDDLPPVRRRFDLDTQYMPRPVKFAGRQNVPPLESEAVRRLGLTVEEQRCYSRYVKLRNRRPSKQTASAAGCKLLGYPDQVEDMARECALLAGGIVLGPEPDAAADGQFRTCAARAEDWLLLLQLDRIWDNTIHDGPVGTLFFWITRQDLLVRRFDHVLLRFQGTNED